MKTLLEDSGVTKKPQSMLALRNLMGSKRFHHIGRRCVVKAICLDCRLSIFGLVIPLSSETEEARKDEVKAIMSEAFDCGFKDVPFGTVSALVNHIAGSFIKLDNPRLDRFSVALPLRRWDNQKQYICWDSLTKNWRTLQLNFSTLKLDSSSSCVMLIVKG